MDTKSKFTVCAAFVPSLDVLKQKTTRTALVEFNNYTFPFHCVRASTVLLLLHSIQITQGTTPSFLSTLWNSV